MKRYLLDTNICIFYMKGKYDLLTRLEKAGRRNCCISEITVAELLYGVECCDRRDATLQAVRTLIDEFTVIPIYETLPVFARLKAALRQRGELIDDFDLLIGSAAVHHNLVMVTENVRHLARLPEIRIENWIQR